MDFIEEIQETDNFLLEPITNSHAKVLFKSLQAVQLYTYIPIDAPKNIESLEAKYKKWEKRFSEKKEEIWLNYAILDKKEKVYKGTLQATIILGKETYIAYEVFPDYWRTGIAKECVAELVKILFTKFQVDEILAHCDTRNIASIKLLESLNFSCLRMIADADFFKNSKSDEYVYQLTNTSWKNKNALQHSI